MPFTISHPAIILPLALLPKKWMSLTGLVLGSMAPDFEYFIRMKLQSDYSHSIGGVFYFDLPLTLILVFLFHNIVRNSLINNLPLILKKRFFSFTDFNWNAYFRNNFIVVVLSIIIGSVSHLFWDSFTLFGGYFVEHIPSLKNTIEIQNFHIPILKILQHGSTLLGVLIIGFVICKLNLVKIVESNSNKYYWILISLMTIVILAIRMFSGLGINEYGNIIVTLISALMISFILTPLILNQRLKND